MKTPRWLKPKNPTATVTLPSMTTSPVEGAFSVVRTSPVRLPRFGSLRRNAPRPSSMRQRDYDQRFDSDTLFYDVFEAERGIRLVGPPLLNLRDAVNSASFLTAEGVQQRVEFNELDRTHSALAPRVSSSAVSLQLESLDLTVAVGPSYTELFSGRKVLLTKSKNNRLEWIRDWAAFHVQQHGVDAVLLYDNGSTDYNCEDVLRALSGIEGLNLAIVVDWPFKFGPQGGDWEGLRNAPWDSDFCEYGILEHARRRFLNNASAVVSLDVDELVISESDRNLFEVLEASDSGAISYEGLWIETTTDIKDRVPRFGDFLYFDSNRGASTKKWSVDPTRTRTAVQWKTHRVEGTEMESAGEVRHRHFMGINSNWKRDRTNLTSVVPGRHVRDELLSKKLAEAAAHATTQLGFQEVKSELTVLQGLLTESDESFNAVSRIWFYREDCLVLDLAVEELRLGIDIQKVPDGFDVKVSGRNDLSRTMLVEQLTSIVPGAEAVGPKHWLVLTADKDTEIPILAEKVATLSARIIEALRIPVDPA